MSNFSKTNVWKSKSKVIALWLIVALVVTMFPMELGFGKKTVAAAETETQRTKELDPVTEYPYFTQENDEEATASKNLGSKENPIKITTAQELVTLAYVVYNRIDNENYLNPEDENDKMAYRESCFQLENDISLSEYKDWNPIGYGSSAFLGIFDGQNHVVSGMYCKISGSFRGFFGWLDGDAVIQNLSMVNAVLETGEIGDIYQHVGILVGLGSNNVTIQNCKIDKTSSLTYDSEEIKVWIPMTSSSTEIFYQQPDSCSSMFGGILGSAFSSELTIENCTNEADIICNGVRDVGGIVGSIGNYYDSGKQMISNCKNTGVIQGNANVGGILGYSVSQDVSIKDSVNEGDVSAIDWSEGLWQNMQSAVNTLENYTNYTVLSVNIVIYDENYSEDNLIVYTYNHEKTNENFTRLFGAGQYAGGIAGYALGTISWCQNTGQVSGGRDIGGITGGFNGSIDYSMNYGTIRGITQASHDIKVNWNGLLSDSSVTEVTYTFSDENSNFGGIAGSVISKNQRNSDNCFDNVSSSIEDCGNSANIPDSSLSGGILGDRNLYSADDTTGEGACVKRSYSIGVNRTTSEPIAVTPNTARDAIASYYLVEESVEEDAFGITQEQFRTGELCRLLNMNEDFISKGNAYWVQQLGKTDFPEISKENTYPVYKVTYCELDETGQTIEKEVVKYQNAGDVVDYEQLVNYTYEYYQLPEEGTEIGEVVSKIDQDMRIAVKKTLTTSTTEPSNDPQPTPNTASPQVTSSVKPTSQATAAPVKKGTTVTSKNVDYVVTGGSTVKVDGSTVAKKTTAKLIIPDTVKIGNKSYKVTEVGSTAFANNNKITQVKLGKNITKVAKKAFKNCKKLKTVTYSNKVSTIGSECFSGCTKLQKAILPSSVKKIGNKAFKNCKSLKKLQIGKKASTKKKGAVSTNQIAGNIRQETESVDDYSTLNLKISIGNNAMENCKNLKSVVVNSAVRVIGNSAFKNCVKLSSIIVRSLILKTVGKKALLGVTKCKISVPTKKFKPYKKLFKNKGQGKKVFVAKA